MNDQGGIRTLISHVHFYDRVVISYLITKDATRIDSRNQNSLGVDIVINRDFGLQTVAVFGSLSKQLLAFFILRRLCTRCAYETNG